MNKKSLQLCALAVIVGVGGFAFYRFSLRKQIPQVEMAQQVRAVLLNNNCTACHSSSAERPFYASFPVIGKTVETDIDQAVKYMDIQKLCDQLERGEKISEVDIAKIEQSLSNGSMPPAKYKAVHWGTSFNKDERAVLTQWIIEHRREHYATNLAAAHFAMEPIQPIVDGLPVNEAKAELGFKLYHDTRLSKDNTVSCATCHLLDKGGVDGLKTSKGIYGQIGGINAPTVYNAALNSVGQFWDGRAADLAMQAGGPPLDMLEMGSNWEEIVSKLSADNVLSAQFASVYPQGWSEETITDAIAEFEKTLITPNSPFDRYLKGDMTAINAHEIEGYELFKANQCATCHVGQNMGGQSFERLGIVADYFADRGTVLHDNKDYGYFNVTKDTNDMHRFKTPTLRNIALTAPYMHDGSAETLEQATELMLKYQTGKSASKQDIEKIVAFLNTLTGENKYMQ
ncbi:MAG: cytochrome c peroxidase [Marinifilaceae bacterium]